MQTRGRALLAVGTGRGWEKASVVRAQWKREVWCEMRPGESPEARSPGSSQDEECGFQPRAVSTPRAMATMGSESSGGQLCRVREKRAGDRGEGRGRGARRGNEKPQAGGDLSLQEGFSVKEAGSGQTAGEEVEPCPG